MDGCFTVEMASQMAAEVASVVSGTVDETRFAPAKKGHAHQIQARGYGDAAVVPDPAPVIEDWDVEPGVVGVIAGGPDDRLDRPASEVQ